MFMQWLYRTDCKPQQANDQKIETTSQQRS